MDPKSKAKSAGMTEEGVKRAKALSVKHFGCKTAQAQLAVSEIRRDIKRDTRLTMSAVDAEIKAVRTERKR